MIKIIQIFGLIAFTGFLNFAAAEPRLIHVESTDGLSLSAIVDIPPGQKVRMPAVIFLHQGGSSKEEWTALPIFQDVTKAGMVAFALDIRGHGGSDGEADFTTLFDDPDQAPRDLMAAMNWLAKSNAVDMDRVAVVGASIGANLAVVAAGTDRFEVRTVVAISAKTSAVHNLAGGVEKVSHLRSVFMIAAELEEDGKRALWAEEIFNAAEDPRQIEIVSGSKQHGVSIFSDDPSLQNKILSWLVNTN
jgi:dienelactone hydrolase